MTIDAVGGVWRYGIDLCRTLATKGTHVLVVGLGPEPSAAQWEEARALRNADFVWLDIPLDWQVDEPGPLASLPQWLGELVHRWEIDLLHLNLPSQAADLKVDRPIVVTSHSCRATWWQAVRGGAMPAEWDWNRAYTARGLQMADLIVAPSYGHAAALERVYGLPPNAVRVVPNGTGAARRIYRKANLVLAAGRWWDDAKNGRAIDAAAEHVDWPVFMAGQLSGPDRQHCRLEHACPLGDRRPDEIRRLMGRTPIFVSASLFEPFGLAVLEAAMAEAALVLSDIPTFRELWHGAALFVDPHDPQALAEAINRLVLDETERLALAQAARRRSEIYTLEAQSERMLQVYDEAMSSHPSIAIPAGQCA
ncbi:MAG TPA: glycosyltransferase family 4 protein [Ferrovibrio sp.]|uniref:glycosyltransferase family 4 protein n=1 Tax=Ferrovibrio sp. TaxID=1917215 RepID=UPI002ED4BEC8